jgi:hypothetical protein
MSKKRFHPSKNDGQVLTLSHLDLTWHLGFVIWYSTHFSFSMGTRSMLLLLVLVSCFLNLDSCFTYSGIFTLGSI